MTEENENVEEEQGEEQEQDFSGVLIRPHALGGLELVARDRNGAEVSVRLGLNEAATLAASAQAHITMLFQSFYQQMAMEERAAQEALSGAGSLYVPPGTRR
jgi:hypothetical protein